MSLEEAYEPPGPADRLASIRADPRQRRLVIAGGLLVGLGLGALHWLGLVLGGALVALPARTIPRGLAHGLALGMVGLATAGLLLAANGALEAALSTGSIGGIAAGIGLAAPLLGAAVRAVV
ncbi:MAG: hypothetical protein ABEH59_05430 [Halobacteriales archaeon]